MFKSPYQEFAKDDEKKPAAGMGEHDGEEPEIEKSVTVHKHGDGSYSTEHEGEKTRHKGFEGAMAHMGKHMDPEEEAIEEQISPGIHAQVAKVEAKKHEHETDMY